MPSNPKFGGMTAVLFAGGQSTRMGEDKTLLPFGGFETLSEYQFRRLEKLFGKVYISTKTPKFDFEAPLLFDRYPQSSPLAGIVSIFESMTEDSCFILSADAPFVDDAVISRLYEESSDPDYDAIIAQSPGGKQPLCGIYRRSILPQAKALLAKENHRLGALLKAANSHFVHFSEESPFKNLNHPHEYASALQTIRDVYPS